MNQHLQVVVAVVVEEEAGESWKRRLYHKDKGTY
jgi:hypothetical protein